MLKYVKVINATTFLLVVITLTIISPFTHTTVSCKPQENYLAVTDFALYFYSLV